jgi:hypothetical protein
MVAACAVMIVVMTAVIVGTPVAAAASNGLLWQLNPELCRSGCTGQANLIRAWQAVLWVDNVGGGINSSNFVDGQFGPNTEAKTKLWQGDPMNKDWNGNPLARDGRAGPRTWWAAQHNASYGGSRPKTSCWRLAPPYNDTVLCRYYQDGYHQEALRWMGYSIHDNGDWGFWLRDGNTEVTSTIWVRTDCASGTCREH